MSGDEKHDEALYMRITKSDVARLDALVAKHSILTKAALARAAMRIGLDEVERDPTVLLDQPAPKRGGARRRRKKR